MAPEPKVPTGRERLGVRFEQTLDREADRLAERPRRTVARYVAIGVATFIVMALLVSAIGFVGGWFNATKEIASPANVKTQYQAVIEDYEALKAAAANACAARDTADTPGDPSLVESPAFAYAAQYRRISVDYNRRQANIFEAKAVGPGGYPRVAPSLSAMQSEVC